MATQLPDKKAVVIGAGFSGLAMGAQLKRKLSLDEYTIYERSPDFGGTWFANFYPGCGVDIPSIFYSLSFAPNPDFTKVFPKQPEIFAYIKDVARRFDVDRHVMCNMSFDGGVWNEDTKSWHLHLSNVKTGEQFTQETKILISAIGGLVNPNPCLIPGVETFKGPIIHTARWDNKVVLEDKNVIVIGNGCSGTQVVPAILPRVKNIYQFFRSSQFYFPRRNPNIHPAVRWAFRYVPFLMVFFRWLLFNFLEFTFIQFHTDARGDRHRAYSKKMSDDYVESTAPKEYWDMLKPKYKVGCKRRVFDPGYLKCLNEPNMHLSGDPILNISENELETVKGKFPADVIILANGFETTRMVLPLVGLNSITPEEHWAKFGGIEAYKSIAMSSFPNFFMIFGPNAATGHTSALFSIEVAIDLAIRMAKPVIKGKEGSVVVKESYEKEYCDRQQAALQDRVWADCKSFYKDGKTGWNFAVFPWNSYKMWWQARFPDMNAWRYSSLKIKDD